MSGDDGKGKECEEGERRAERGEDGTEEEEEEEANKEVDREGRGEGICEMKARKSCLFAIYMPFAHARTRDLNTWSTDIMEPTKMIGVRLCSSEFESD